MTNFHNSVEIAPCVVVIDNAIDNPEQVIELALQESADMYDAEIFLPSGELSVIQDIRKNKIIEVGPTYSKSVFWWELSQKIWSYGNEYGKKYNISFSNMETSQFLWYEKNNGFYKPHTDSHGMSRVFSAVLYLNDVKKGGETHFEYLNISIKPKAGRLILFPANFAYMHGAKTPKSNDKYVVVTWFNP